MPQPASPRTCIGRLRVVVLVPYRADTGARAKAWRYVRPILEELGYPIFVGDDGTQPFSVSRSWNHAAELAGDWDRAILHAPDVILDDPARLHHAVEEAADRMVYAYNHYKLLNAAGTQILYQGGKPPERHVVHQRRPAQMIDIGGPRAIPRALWERVGGFDPRFIGWGGEDTAFAHCCRILAGPSGRLPGVLWSLYHPRHRKTDPFYGRREANRVFARETKAITDPVLLAEYLASR